MSAAGPDPGGPGRGRGPRSAALLLMAGLLAAGCGGEAGDEVDGYRLDRLFRVGSLEQPESVAWDGPRDRWLVAGGGTADGRGGGHVTAVGAGGDSVRRLWAGPASIRLGGARGITAAGDTAWIAGGRELVAVDLAGDSVLFRSRVRNARRLHDVARGEDGSLFVSDAGAGIVWRIEPGGASHARQPAVGSLRGPDGLLAEGFSGTRSGRLLVAGAEGAVLAVDPDSSVVLLAESPRFGRLDGLQRASDGGLVVGDRGTGRLHHLRRHSARVWRTGRPWLTGLAAPADFVLRDTLLALPESDADRLTVYRVRAP